MKQPVGKVTKEHPYSWVWEPLEELDGFLLRSMFGAKTVYIKGRIMLCVSAGSEPWNGVCLCTEREQHESLLRDFPALVPHPILPKWLYLSSATPDFEGQVARMTKLIRKGDARIGVLPKPRKSRARKGGPIKFGDKL